MLSDEVLSLESIDADIKSSKKFAQTATDDDNINKDKEFGEDFYFKKHSAIIDSSSERIENILQLNILGLRINHSQNGSI